MANRQTMEDMDQPLFTIVRRGESISTMCLEIQKMEKPHNKSEGFLANLECFAPVPSSDPSRPILERHCVDAFKNHRYVSVSYTWKPSEFENMSSPNDSELLYYVQSRDGVKVFPSPVRSQVFTRTIKYMHYECVRLLWIDKHSIKQCERRYSEEKKDGLESMDRVYAFSDYPLALLWRQVRSERELALLARLLRGHLVKDRLGGEVTDIRRGRRHRSQLSEATSRGDAWEVLQLVADILRDDWWLRAWTYQEAYCGGAKMNLLLPHEPSLEVQKRGWGEFRRIPGELCIRFRTLTEQITKLCLAFQHQTKEEEVTVEQILRKAGKYTVLLKDSESMTRSIISDVALRGISEPMDRLPVIGNCCGYSRRLDVELLQESSLSVSLATLTMCLINGEILDNRKEEGRCVVSALSVGRFLERYLFRGFHAPEPESHRKLSFYKSYRFSGVRLTREGVQTKGHLWTLGKVIDTSRISRGGSMAWWTIFTAAGTRT